MADMAWARRRSRLPGSAGLTTSVPPPAVALTFDDGPDPVGTPAVLEALGSTRATFFLLVDRAEAHRELAREIVDRGHSVGLHGLGHEPVDRIGAGVLSVRLRDGASRLEHLCGCAVSLFRPPFGRAAWRTFRAARRARLEMVLWSHDPRDWEPGGAARIGACIVPGAVVLLHDGSLEYPSQGRETAEALARIIPGASARNLRLCSL